MLGRFSHVLLVGDSLLATVANGLQFLVSGDFATGVLRPNASPEAHKLCTCDGQMSASVRCRSEHELNECTPVAAPFDARKQELGLWRSDRVYILCDKLFRARPRDV